MITKGDGHPDAAIGGARRCFSGKIILGIIYTLFRLSAGGLRPRGSNPLLSGERLLVP